VQGNSTAHSSGEITLPGGAKPVVTLCERCKGEPFARSVRLKGVKMTNNERPTCHCPGARPACEVKKRFYHFYDKNYKKHSSPAVLNVTVFPGDVHTWKRSLIG
jgi:hypothetical protein